MPIYEYSCPKCQKKIELLRSMSSIDEPAECPHCKGVARRNITSFSCRTSVASGVGASAQDVSLGGGGCGSCSSGSCSSCG
jgi:putative FmdB family regulatory protein